MSFFRSLLGGGSGEQKALTSSDLPWVTLGGGSKAGVPVNVPIALKVAVFIACCRVLCEDTGKVPSKMMQEGEDGSKRVAREQQGHILVARRPNQWQTPMEWKMTMMLHALTRKAGGVSWINRSSEGDPLELIPLVGNVVAKQDGAWNVTYDVTGADGRTMTLRRDEVHVLRGLSLDGYQALDMVTQGTDAIGLTIATEETQARLHAQGVRPGGTLNYPQPLTDQDQRNRIVQQFQQNYGGVANSFKIMLLDAGIKFEPWTMTGVDAQHLETRLHQAKEICRLMRVFPSMVGLEDKASTYASAEAFFTAHVVHSLMPWVTLWEQSMDRDLLTSAQVREGYHFKFFLQGLLRGDAASRAAFYKAGITDGWMNRNEARAYEDLNPVDGLSEFLRPLNMTSGTEPPPVEDPAPAPAAPAPAKLRAY